jgi:hypothetical protein
VIVTHKHRSCSRQKCIKSYLLHSLRRSGTGEFRKTSDLFNNVYRDFKFQMTAIQNFRLNSIKLLFKLPILYKSFTNLKQKFKEYTSVLSS